MVSVHMIKNTQPEETTRSADVIFNVYTSSLVTLL